MSEFVLMLTHNDETIENAVEVWRDIAPSGVSLAGFKDTGIAERDRRRLVEAIRSSGSRVMLEIVSQTREEELRAVESALALEVDYLLGGVCVDEVSAMIHGTTVGYMPFPGRVCGHPVRLEGLPQEIADDAKRIVTVDGVTGVDLLAYRHPANPEGVIAAVVLAVDEPVLIAGSIKTHQQVARISKLGAWAFTVGSALFDGGFGPPEATLRDRVENVLAAARCGDDATASVQRDPNVRAER